VEAKVGKVFDDRRVPFDFPVVDQYPNGHRGESLGAGADGKQGPRGDRKLLPEVSVSKAVRVDNLSVFDDANGETRHFV
jgi:hypothetical protein